MIRGGWINRHWKQFPIQMASTAAGALWSFAVSFIILWTMNQIPFLRMRVDIESETTGLDLAEMGEAGYSYFAHNHPKNPTSTLVGYPLDPHAEGSVVATHVVHTSSEPPRGYSPDFSSGLQMNMPEKPLTRAETAPPYLHACNKTSDNGPAL